MAKQQSFADKTQKKAGDATKVVRLVFSYKAADTGVWRFSDKLVKMGADENEQQVLDQEIKKGRARLEKN